MISQSQHVRPLLLLGALVCGFYAPQLATGTVQWDGVDVHYASQRFFADALASGRLPFWTPYIFGGFPFLADVQLGAWYPLNWPFFVAGIGAKSISGELLLHSLIACGGAYVLGIRLFARPLPALATAILYAMSGWFATHSQHVGMFQTAAWLPWLVVLVSLLGDQITVARLALASVLGAALALPGHFQVALYAFCGAGLWAVLDAALSRTWRRPLRRMVGLLAVGGGGAALAAIMILPGLELAGLSLRTRLNARAAPDVGYFQVESLLTLVQPDHFGLLSGNYSGPGDVTQHYFYAGIVLVPLVLVGAFNRRALRMALLLGLPFVWYAIGPSGGLFRVIARLPGFSSVELPMHGWFLPALGLAVLGGAGVAALATRLRPVWVGAVLAAMFVDMLVFNELLNPLAYARQSFDTLYGVPLRAFAAEVQAAQPPPVVRLYGPPLASVGYRNHPLQSHIETTYGYNPLELAAYSDYVDAAERNPRLIDGMAATHRLADDSSIRANAGALPLAYFARRVVVVPDAAAAAVLLAELDPGVETVVIGLPGLNVANADLTATAHVVERGDDHLTIHVQTNTANVLRVAIPMFPGWHASRNGAELPLVNADLAFQGILVPAGEGDVHLQYMPRWFELGALISLLALLVCLAVLGRAAVVQRGAHRRRVTSAGRHNRARG